MYSALSNSADTTRYLDILERGGMVTRETGVYKIQYALTEKGRAFLAKLVELEKEFPEVW
jgi:predicted transcriptional regulator